MSRSHSKWVNTQQTNKAGFAECVAQKSLMQSVHLQYRAIVGLQNLTLYPTTKCLTTWNQDIILTLETVCPSYIIWSEFVHLLWHQGDLLRKKEPPSYRSSGGSEHRGEGPVFLPSLLHRRSLRRPVEGAPRHVG